MSSSSQLRPQKPTVCGCTTRAWVTIIACIQIALGGIAVILALYFIPEHSAYVGSYNDAVEENWVTEFTKYVIHHIYDQRIHLANGGANVALGSMLLIGVTCMEQGFLVLWLILSSIGFAAIAVGLLVMVFLLMFVGGTVFGGIIVLIIGSLYLWLLAVLFYIVNIHHNKMIEPKPPSDSDQWEEDPPKYTE